jgi:hypothetical protein
MRTVFSTVNLYMCIYDLFHIQLSLWHSYWSMEYMNICMYVYMYVYVKEVYWACLEQISGSWSPRSINRESHSSNSVSSKAPSSLLHPPPPSLFFTTCWNEQRTRINITMSRLLCADHVSHFLCFYYIPNRL